MKNNKLNNKGFSLVELIIVIAIMAILAAALAPQLIKYIEKSRVSTDKTSCASIKSAFDSASADETVFKEVVAKAGTQTVTITDSSDVSSGCTSVGSNFASTMASTLSDLKAPKSDGATNYVLSWDVEDGEVTNISVDTDNGVMSK